MVGLGDSFSTGDVLLEIETDKAQMEVEAQDDGKLAKITVRLFLGSWYHCKANPMSATRWLQGG